ncbi:hypothetical protein EON62_03770 [archaeon]|nr:MAG: hypothetical protein EON62_03770 [archaeon]
MTRTLHDGRSLAVLQLLFISTGPQMNMPWASMPIMYDGIYLFLHSLSFIPHQAVPRADGGSDSTVAFPPLNLFIFAIIFTVVMVRARASCGTRRSLSSSTL